MENVAITENKTKEVIMPRNDQTGPNGNGPMTGRRMGNCAGNQREETFFGRRQGNGFWGRYQNRFIFSGNSSGLYSNNLSKEIIAGEIKTLKTRLIFLENELEKTS